MFDSGSRYANLETVVVDVPGPDGEPRPVRFVKRRFIPQGGEGTTLVEHTVTQGDRLDVITARYLADPLQFWRVADANNAMRPEELTEEPGTTLRIALPEM
jgi:hypothetical protein